MRFRFGEVRRNKRLIVLLLPLIACVFIVGWVMYVAGQVGSGVPQKSVGPVKDRVVIGSVPVEEVLTVEQ